MSFRPPGSPARAFSVSATNRPYPAAMTSQPASNDLPPAVATWRDQIERLSEHASPCRYLLPAKWKAMRENALPFLDQHGAEAHRLGWTAEQLFGVHPEHGFLRVEYAGAPRRPRRQSPDQTPRQPCAALIRLRDLWPYP